MILLAAKASSHSFTARSALDLYRRRTAAGFWLNLSLGILMAASLLVGAVTHTGVVPFAALAVAWTALLFYSTRAMRLAVDSATLIEAGRFDEAELMLRESLTAFSLLRVGKTIGLKQLATLRHSEKRWGDAIELCRELVSQTPTEPAVQRTSRLMLADSLLAMNQVSAAGFEIAAIDVANIDLHDSLWLLAVRIDWQSRTGQYHAICSDISRSTQLTELMPTAMASRTQTLIAEAAFHVGLHQWASFLKLRSHLLMRDPVAG